MRRLSDRDCAWADGWSVYWCVDRDCLLLIVHVHVYMHDQFTKKCGLQMYGEIAGSGHTKLTTINIDIVITCKICLIPL